MRVLVVEDEKRINEIISEAMRDEGYSTDSCFNGAEALEYAACAVYDVIIMDIMMPVMDGITAVRELRHRGCSSPVLFLTAKDSIADKVEGLESGADYYLVKPFNYDELIAVIHAMTRKYSQTRSNVYSIADLTLNSATKEVTRAGRPISLTAREFSLLEFLIRNSNVVVTRAMIEDNLWNYDYEGGTNVVDVYIGYLRKKIDSEFDQKLIHTVWGTGWKLSEQN